MASQLAKVVMTLDGQRVEVGLDKIREKTRQLKTEMHNLAMEGKQNSKEYKDRQKAVEKLHKAEEDVVDVTKRINQYMKNLGKVATTDLRRAYREGIQLREGYKGTDKELKKLNADLAAMKAQIDKNTGSTTALTKAQQGFSGALQTTLKNLVAYMGIFAGFNFVKGKVIQVFEANVKLSDSLANIRKVSGLTKGEISQLYDNITKIDTRNSVEQLNNLAYAGAKLGIQEHGGVSALTGFVKAAEQVQMALGEDLGEDALPALAKLTEVMGLMDQYGVEEAMQKAASSIFMLSTTSTSTGANIVEFSKRLMGLANVSHITASELLALGSASDSMGLMAEVSSTAFNKVFTKIQSNTAGIEKAVGLAKGSLKSLVDEGKTMDAIVTVFEKMRDMSMEEMQKRGIFTALGSDGARLNNVMTTMADRVDMLKKHLKESNKAFEEGEAVIAEYMIQNETAAAYMERAANLWTKAFTNSEGIDAVSQFAKQWHEVSLELTQSTLMMGTMKAALYSLLTAAKLLLMILPTLVNFLLFKGSLAVVTMLVQGFWNMSKGIWACVTASKALTAAQKWNALTTALSLVAAAFVTIKSSMNEAEEAAERARQHQEELDKAFAASKDTIDKSTKSLTDYKTALDKSNLSQDERDKRLKAYLKNEYQPYLDYLGIEIDKVEDLADAYEQVVFAMKQKAAAEEKKNYLSNVVGDTRNNRIASQADVIREAKKMGFTIDKAYLEKNQYLGLDKLYRLIMESALGVKATRQTGKNLEMYTVNGKYYNKGKVEVSKNDNAGWTYATNDDLYNAVNKYITLFREERDTTKKVNDMFNEEYKDLDLEHFSLDKFREKQLQAQIEREKKRKNTIIPTLPDKDAIKSEKEALRKELQDAKRDSDAVISKIEEWYRLQETVITDMQADGKLTKEQAEQVVRTLNIAKNTALRDARLAISGRDTKAWESTKKEIGNLMLDQGEWSAELLQQILNVSMESIRQNIANIDRGGGQYGITTSSLKDAVDKNAAGNQREIAQLRAKSKEEVKKILLEYHYVETAINGFSNRLAQMGILTETAQQMAERLSDAKDIETLFSMKDYDRILQGNEQAKRDMLKAFIGIGSQKYRVNPEDKEQMRQWFMEFVGQYVQSNRTIDGVDYQYKSWAKPFEKDFETWLRDSDNYLDKIQAFYFSLIKSEDEYYDAMKKAYQKQKTLFAQRWENSGRAEYYDRLLKQLDMRKRGLSLTDRNNGTNFGDIAGFGVVNEDPEIAASLARMQQAREELETFRKITEQKKMAGEELAAFQKNLREKEMAATEAEMAMQEQLMKSINDRISKLQEWTAPIEAFGTEVGQALYDQWHNGESMSAKWQDMLKKMGLAWGQLTVKIVSELMMQRIKKQILDKAMQADAIKHQATLATIEQTGGQTRQLVQQATGQALAQGNQATNTLIESQNVGHNATMLSEDAGAAAAENPVNISRAAGKTLAGLGWWGIPLVAVVTALLNALLQAALGSSSSKSSSSSSSSTSDATKLKIVSNMLTYDAGNIQHFIGQDGRVYAASVEPAPRDGLITHPIATTVQGQPALVAEKGPEIVLGRETTRAIMMNEPELIRYLANYQQHGGRRLFDEGTPVTVAGASPATTPDGSPATTPAGSPAGFSTLIAAIATFNRTVEQMQQKGIPCYINKYGTGGLIDEVKSGLKFDQRYGG